MEKTSDDTASVLLPRLEKENNNLPADCFEPFEIHSDNTKTAKKSSMKALAITLILILTAIASAVIALALFLKAADKSGQPPYESVNGTKQLETYITSSTQVSSLSSIVTESYMTTSLFKETSYIISFSTSHIKTVTSTTQHVQSSMATLASTLSATATSSLIHTVSPTHTVTVLQSATISPISSTIFSSTFVTPSSILVTSSTISPSTSTTRPVCREDEFQCNDGSCINRMYVCDGHPHCSGGEEENINCTCASDQFRCSSGQCISNQFQCDGNIHCLDQSDEINCTNCKGFQCRSGLCLWSPYKKCNGYIDCDDFSDELNCVRTVGNTRCNNGLWVPNNKWCDGIDDCFDNSDEKTCVDCSPSQFQCQNGKCIMMDWECDGQVDCSEREDEANCDQCSAQEHTCSDYNCVPQQKICNGINDCKAGTDEMSCVELRGTKNDLEQESGVLMIQTRGEDNKYPVCAASLWTQQASNLVCKHLGQQQGLRHTNVSLSQSGLMKVTSFYHLTASGNMQDSVLKYMEKRSACDSSLVISLTCMPKECGRRKVEILTPLIAGGSIAPKGKWPWVVSLSHMGKDICGGSLISNQWVLTAAHCILQDQYDYSKVPYNFEVLLGTNDRSRVPQSTAQRIQVKRVFLHPNTTRTMTGSTDWDTALLYLSKPVEFTDYIQPLCLPDANNVYSASSVCYLAGWGYINPAQLTVREMRDAKMSLWDDEMCEKNVVTGEKVVNIDTTLCAGYKSGAISGCQGDSGSPLMCQDVRGRWSQAGILSSGNEACDGRQFNRANRFTRMTNIVDWIVQIMKKNS
ncbi:hypothetical protein CHS0354_018682 [Potamilus streckersoni]|uniref:Acrosin n=1 Tax=Potamilus streckersoni TaxID=2493646 RepID=A0AAE0SKB7_9BIVA|nr:hypothetical protein CHS0354_018682 [Potamilus streckersoni]